MPDIIVVLGMHRSCTSAMTRALEVFGVDLGCHLMPAVANDNDKGYFEDLDIFTLNQKLLKSIDLDWDHISFIDEIKTRQLIKSELFLDAVEILKKRKKGKKLIGIKDPRFSGLLPFWRRVFEHCDYSVYYIVMIRNPQSVSKSLLRRRATDKKKLYYMWFANTYSAIENTKDCTKLVVQSEKLLSQPETVLNDVMTKFNLNLDKSMQDSYITDFLDSDLLHHDFSIEDLEVDPDIPKIVKDYYLSLLSLSTDKQPNLSNGIEMSYISELMDYNNYLQSNTNQLIESHNSKVNILVEDINKLNSEISFAKDFLMTRSASCEKNQLAFISKAEQSLLESKNLFGVLTHENKEVKTKNEQLEQLFNHHENLINTEILKRLQTHADFQKEVSEKIDLIDVEHKLTKENQIAIFNLENENKNKLNTLQDEIDGLRSSYLDLLKLCKDMKDEINAVSQESSTTQMQLTGEKQNNYVHSKETSLKFEHTFKKISELNKLIGQLETYSKDMMTRHDAVIQIKKEHILKLQKILINQDYD
jgi:hypothetical protein